MSEQRLSLSCLRRCVELSRKMRANAQLRSKGSSQLWARRHLKRSASAMPPAPTRRRGENILCSGHKRLCSRSSASHSPQVPHWNPSQTRDERCSVMSLPSCIPSRTVGPNRRDSVCAFAARSESQRGTKASRTKIRSDGSPLRRLRALPFEQRAALGVILQVIPWSILFFLATQIAH